MAAESKISDDEILSAFKADQPTVSQPVSSKDETKGISDDEILSAFKGDVLGTRTSGGTLSGGGEMFRPEMVGSVTPPEQSSLIGSGALGSGQFASISVGSKGKFDEYAGITEPNTRKGIAETVFKGITNPHDLEELNDKVPWYNIADNPVQIDSLFEYKWNKPSSVIDIIASAGKAGMGMLESLPPLVAGAGRLGKEALSAAVYVGDPSAYGIGTTLSEEQKQKMTAQQIQEAELSPRDRTIRASRAAGDAALEAGEGLLGAVTKFKEGKSMLYDKGRVAFAAATTEGTFGDPSIAPAISAEDENARRTAAIAPAMAEARKNFVTRINAKHVEHMQKEKSPAVLARTVDAVFNYPAVKRYAADLIENLMPPAEDAAPGFGGDIEAAKAARRAHAEEATNVAVQAMVDEANRLKEDPEQVGAIAMTTPLNMFGMGGKIVGTATGVGQRIGRGLRAAGMTAEAERAMYAADSAALQAQRATAARLREQPGFLEKPIGSLADTIDKVPVFLSKIPEPVQYAGAALFGAGAGAVTSDDPLIGALKGATTGAGIKLGGKALLAAPRLGEELLKAGRLSGAELGRFEALEKMESALPAVQRFVNWSQKAGGGKALDFIEKNANVFVQHNVSMLPMMVAMGVLEDKDAQELAQMWAEFATYGFIHGQVLGGLMGNDPIRNKMDRDSQMRQAQRVMLGFSPESREAVTTLNWDKVIKQSEKRLDRAQKTYFAEMVNGANTPEAAKAKADYKFAYRLHQENIVAPPEARQAFEDGIKLSLGKVSNLINGVLTPNSNMNIELLTSSQIIDKMIAANPNFNGVGAPMTVEQALEKNPTADGINITKGTTKDGFTMDPAKDTVFVNVENALKKAELSGEAISNVLAHEVAGHGLFGKDEYRKMIAPLYNKMFGTEAIDENGNVREITPAQPGMSREDLFEKFFNKYLKNRDPQDVASYAEAAGVWDKANNTFDKNKIVELMREETLAEAHAGMFFGDPESPLQRGISWIASRVSSGNVKSALNHLYAIAGPAVYKEWTSGKVGATYSPEVMRAIRNVEREMKKYDGDFTDAEQGSAVAAPITKKDVIKSKEMLNKYYKDTGKFETTPVAMVTDADGKVVQTVKLKDNDASEGSWIYHQDDATGENVPNKEKGFGELHPELVGLEVPVGGRIQVERQIAYDEATGKPKERKNKETVAHIKRRVQMVRDAIDNAGDPSQLGRFRAVGGKEGDEDLHYTGKMTLEQRAAIGALPESVVPASMKELLLKYDDLMTRADGTVLDIDYASRLNDKGNYQAFSPKIRQIVPLQLHLSKAGNFYTTAWDISDLRRKVRLYEKYAKGVFEPWGGDTQKFWNEFRTVLLPNLANPDANVPGWQGLDAEPNVAKLKRTIYEKMLGAPNPNVPDVESIPDLPREKFSRSEKKLDKQSSFDQIIKSFRLDSHTAAEENANSEYKYPIPYKARFLPEQAQTTEEQRPAFGVGLLKGLQAISAKYNPKGTEEVRALVQPAEAQVRFMPSPAEEDYHHAEGRFPKTETSETYKMSAIHKISDDALLFADKMGGLAVPSIAVVKAGTGIQRFGGITLVGGRDLVDPKTNPVFSGDAYTQRFPKPEYPRVKTKKAQQVIDLFKPAQSQFSHSYGDNVTDVIWDNAVNRPNPEEAVNKLKKSNVAKAAYLGDAAPKPITRTVSQDLGILDTVPMKKWLSKNSLQDINYADVEVRKSLGDAIKGGFDEIYPEELNGKANRIGSRFVGEDGQATVGSISRLEADLRNYGKTEIDSAETQKALDAALIGKESDFYQWVENTIEGMYEAPRIRVAGKWEPYNLENITRVMTSGKTAGVEKSMTQSTGLTAAQMAKRFGSLQEMRNTAEAPWGIRPESEVNEARAQVSEVLRQYRNAMTPFYNGSTWDALDTSMSALGAYYRSGRGGETKMKQTLSGLGFTNVPSNVVKQAVEAANAMSAAPVKYFEAKPQRVVQLNEFQGAIVPDNVDPGVLSVLQKNGIETRIIPSDKADDSAYVGSEIDKLKGGKQAQEQAGIRFMPEREEDPTMVAPGFYSKAGRVLLDKMPNRASAEQIRGILDPQKGSGVKPDEMKWSGINQFIDAAQAEKGFVTKDDVKQFLKDGYAAKFETQTAGEDSMGVYVLSQGDFSEKFKTEEDAKFAQKIMVEHLHNDYLRDTDLDASQNENDKWVITDRDGDEYRGYKNDTGREIWSPEEYYDTEEKALNALFDGLLEEAKDKVRIEYDAGENQTQYSKYKLPGGTNYEETVLRMPGVDYTSNHFNDVPNYVAHMRTQDFGNGRVIEEVQSDLHSDARKKGYKRLPDTTGWAEVGIADAPFRKDWPLQLFKHALQKAVADGKKWIGWTGGETQADRYSLSKHVSAIDLINDGDGKYRVRAYQNTDGSALPTSVINKPGLSAQEVADTIGKPLAEKLIADLNSQSDPVTAYAKAEGLDLNVGGEGMKGFYDTILPNEIGKYVKQWGATVEQGTVPNPEKAIRGLSVGSDGTNFFLNKGQFGERLAGVGPFKDYFEAEDARAALSKGQEQIWKVAITPEMSESVAGGQARFMPDKLDSAHAAAYEVNDEAKARELVRKAAKRVQGRQVNYTTVISPKEITPRNEITNRSQFDLNVLNFEKNGWMGRPLLVVETWNGDEAITGSHRLLAAEAAGLKEIPVVKIDLEEYQEWLNENPSNIVVDVDGFLNNTREEDQLSALREAKKEGFKADWLQSAIDLLHIEDESNWQSDYKSSLSDSPFIVGKSVKSADPFTYDNAGKLIPLSERFNPASNDIRFMPEKSEDEAVRLANSTARAAGAVGAKAITPRYVASITKEGDSVLNFGAGKPDKETGKYLHSEMVRENGGNVEEYDFGGNSTGSLGKQYDTVFASNVLNVQSSEGMLESTLSQIWNSVGDGGRAVFNFPESPRYIEMTPAEVAGTIKDITGAEPVKVGGTSKAPLWEVKKPEAPTKGALSGVRFMPLSEGAQAELSPEEKQRYANFEKVTAPLVQMSKPDSEYDHLRVGTALLGTKAKPLDTPQTSNIAGAIVPDVLLASQLGKMNYPHLPQDVLNEKNPIVKRDKMVAFMKDNLKALYDAFPAELRARATQWYDGARKLADGLSEKHSDITPEQSAGILAVFSPQKDWFMNVAQAYQCADVYKNEQDTVISREFAGKEIEGIINAAQAPQKQKLKAPKGRKETPRQKTIRQNKNKALDQKAKNDRRKILEQLYDRRLADLSDGTKEGDILEAWGIRVLAQIKFGRRYKNIAPEGDLLSNARNKKGDKELTNTWGSTGEIRKAVSIMKDGSLKNISDKLGDEHKVRNFYNNIIAPNTPFGDVTIDTHAVAAAHLMPYGSSADAVSDNFGGAGKSAPLGISGSYHIYMDAYQQLAKELGILPRQLQSITWEAIRELYPSEVRNSKLVKEAVQIWKQNSENDARQYILRNGVSAPVWARATNN